MFNNVPLFRADLKNIWESKEVAGKTIINRVWVLENGGHVPLFYYIDKSKLTPDKFVKIVSNFNREFLEGNVDNITFDESILSGDECDELCSTIKLFVMFRITFGIEPKLLIPVVFKNIPYRFNRIVTFSISSPIVELNMRNIIDVDCQVVESERIGGHLIAHGKIQLELLGSQKIVLNFVYHSKNNVLIIDDKDLTLYYNMMKNPHNAHKVALDSNTIYYELKITNYIDENHKTYTVLFKIYDVSIRNKAFTIYFIDDVHKLKYKKHIKFSKVVDAGSEFIIDDKYRFNKNHLLVISPTLFNKFSDLSKN